MLLKMQNIKLRKNATILYQLFSVILICFLTATPILKISNISVSCISGVQCTFVKRTVIFLTCDGTKTRHAQKFFLTKKTLWHIMKIISTFCQSVPKLILDLCKDVFKCVQIASICVLQRV